VLWLTLFSPLGALAALMGMQRFEAWMLAAVPIRAKVEPGGSSRPDQPFEWAQSGRPRALVPRPRAPQYP
jgi:hypothetical protein